MRTVAEHLDNIRDKPHHIRRQVAIGTAAGITGIIAVAWLGLSVYTGTFALKPANFAQVTGAEPAPPGNESVGVAGAAAAQAAGDTATPNLDVVPAGGAQTTPPADPSSGQTIIPF